MLNCISGMVEKTQRAISILQQRQSEAANVRSAEELVADIQAKASLAILEVKQSAVDEIKQLRLMTDKQNKLKTKEEVSCMMIIISQSWVWSLLSQSFNSPQQKSGLSVHTEKEGGGVIPVQTLRHFCFASLI